MRTKARSTVTYHIMGASCNHMFPLMAIREKWW